jgi:hypothetical protein
LSSERLKGEVMRPLAAVLVVISGVISGALALAAQQETPQEKPKVPKDSIELTVVGCLTGRILKTSGERRTDVETSPFVGERTFRLNTKKPLTDELKKQQGHLIEVTGIVKRSALDDRGMKAGPATFSGGSPVAGTKSIPSAAAVADVPVMDVSALRMRASTCGPQ